MAFLSALQRPGLRLALLLGLGAWASPALRAQAVTASEYQLKAVFLFNFAQFTEWPAAAFTSLETPLIIGVLGDDPFGRMLDDTVQAETIGGRKLAVRRYRRVEEIADCHILFISQSESDRLGAILTALKGRSILTVGDTTGYALRGVMIRFMNDRGRIRLRVNLETTRAAGLVISSKLLRSAEIVTTQEN